MTNLRTMSDRELSEAVCNSKNIRELNKLEAEQARRLQVRASLSRLIESVAAKHGIDLQAEMRKSQAVERNLAELRTCDCQKWTPQTARMQKGGTFGT